MERKDLRAHKRKTKRGLVVSDKMQGTVVVQVEHMERHPKYEKMITRSKKYYADRSAHAVRTGDTVDIVETRPLSKLKRWRVVAVEPASRQVAQKEM
jgi:small subunit ribosomal protein S17